MSVQTKKVRKVPQTKLIGQAIVAAVAALYDAHATEIAEFRDTSEESKVTVNFGAEIDCSESEPKVKVAIRFSKAVTDNRVTMLDDPDQLNLLTPEQYEKKKAVEKEEKGSESPGDGDHGE